VVTTRAETGREKTETVLERSESEALVMTECCTRGRSGVKGLSPTTAGLELARNLRF
jgi:hypothetical protein